MWLLRLCVNRPVTVAVGAIFIVLAGVISISRVPVQLTPNVDATTVTVRTFWEGASPLEIESEIVREQEEKLKNVTDLVKMSSVCQQSEGVITLEFKVGADQSRALRDVSDRLREVERYPDGADEPVVRVGDDRNRDYIAWIIVRNLDQSYDVRQSFDFFDERIRPQIERVNGVSEVRVLGGVEREVQVRVDSDALAQRNVTIGQLVAALQQENINASAGQLPEGKRDIRLRIVGKFTEPAQILETVVAERNGIVTRVRDVGEVVRTYKEPSSSVRSKGLTSMAINVQREPGSNVLAVMSGVKDVLNELNSEGGVLDRESRRLGLSTPLRLEQVYDQTTYIYAALDLVTSNIYVGGALATICLLLFLRSWRATLILAITIPVSVVGSFTVLDLLGRNVNVISLAGMAFAVGMVVDNAIVVLENIYRRRQLGDPARQAALRGGLEVWGAVLVSTLTTVVVFIPVLTIQEEVGQLFRDIALAICAAVLLSMLAALTIIPTTGARLLGAAKLADPNRRRNPIARALDRVGALRDVFIGALDRANRSWTVRIAVVATITIASLVGATVLLPPATYLPAGNRNLIFAFMIPPPGYNLAMMEDVGARVEATMRPYWEAQPGTPEAAALPEVPAGIDERGADLGTVQPPPMDNFFFVTFGPNMFMGASSADEQRVRPLINLFNYAARPERIPGVYAFPTQAALFNVGGGAFGANSVELEILGDDVAEVRNAAGALLGKAFELAGTGAIQSARPDPPNFNISSQEVRVEIDRVRAAELGMTVADVANAVRVFGDGAIIGEFEDTGDAIDLRVVDQRQVNWDRPGIDFSTLGSASVATPMGRTVPLAAIADFARVDSPQQINRIEERRSVKLIMQGAPGQSLETMMESVQSEMIQPLREAGAIPNTVITNLAGAADKLTQVRRAMLGDWSGGLWDTVTSILSSRIFLALLFAYLLMCALFESFLYPIVILVSVPLALVGGVLGLRLVHTIDPTQQLDTLTMLGFVILIGVVVNNAVLIVAQTLNFMRGVGESPDERIERLPHRKAVIEATRSRVRPILMTTATSVLGMAPLVIQPGSGSELYRGLGAVVIGGLLCSSLFTLILCPLLLSMVLDVQHALGMLDLKDEGEAKAGQQGRRPEEARPAAREHAAPAVAYSR